MSGRLTQDQAYIFRIVHRANVPWILTNGMHCRNASIRDPDFVSIGNANLIERRHSRDVPCPPHGSLSDYVPFYFTPITPMLYNIKTGYNGVRQRRLDEIVIFASSLHKLRAEDVPFLFTDRHANLAAAQFFDDLAMLGRIDWELLRRRDFKRDLEDPSKVERYQAEALVHRYLPPNALLAILCYTDAARTEVQQHASARGCGFQVATRPEWYV